MKAPVVKNESYETKIVDIGSEGQGIGKIENFTVFIPEALIDELVEVKIIKVNKSFAVGKLMRIIEASKDRVEPA
ncbi:MAG: TRAM domain-containing protein, partial [Anaerotignaceae bacterium]